MLHFANKSGVKVDMRLADMEGNRVIFGEGSELSVAEPSAHAYVVTYQGEFDTLNHSAEGDFSFMVNFELTYH